MGIITHPITHAELKGLKQKGGESLRDYYRRFGELRAQVHDITEREVIEAFSHRIMARWQFQDFCKEDPKNNEEFRRTVEKNDYCGGDDTRKVPGKKQPRQPG